MSGLKREDEYRLKELTLQCEEKGRSSLSEDDMLQLLLLEDRYNKFLDEGLKKLREAPSATSPRSTIKGLFGRVSSPRTNESSESGGADQATSASGAATVSSPLVAPVQAAGKHWTWIFDFLVVGAIPFASQTTDTPGHLCELTEQCFQRKARIAAVVSCLDVEEPIPPGFAVARDWELQHNTNTFFHVACIPRTATPADAAKASAQLDAEVIEGAPLAADPHFEEIIAVCGNIVKLCEIGGDSASSDKSKQRSDGIRHRLSLVSPRPEKRKVVYVHCKTGLARSWVFAMCFILIHMHRSFDEADAYLRSLRAFDPKPFQVTFVQRFAEYVKSPRFAAHSDEEEKYIRILTDVLSLSPKYRLKLLQDLEKLT